MVMDDRSATQKLDQLLLPYDGLSKEGYQGMTGFQAHIHGKKDAEPVYFKLRPVPYAIKEAVKAELDKLESHGVIKKTDCAD